VWGFAFSAFQTRPASEAAVVPAAIPAAWGLAVATLVLTVFGVVLAVVNRHSHLLPAGNGFDGSLAVLAVAYGTAGWLLATRRPRLIFGWLLLAAGLGDALSTAVVYPGRPGPDGWHIGHRAWSRS
jgi:hypothetical protein